MTTAKNDITGDFIASKTTTTAYRDGWERIFGKARRAQALEELAAESQGLGFYDSPSLKENNDEKT